jgi:hypothetical protein
LQVSAGGRYAGIEILASQLSLQSSTLPFATGSRASRRSLGGHLSDRKFRTSFHYPAEALRPALEISILCRSEVDIQRAASDIWKAIVIKPAGDSDLAIEPTRSCCWDIPFISALSLISDWPLTFSHFSQPCYCSVVVAGTNIRE